MNLKEIATNIYQSAHIHAILQDLITLESESNKFVPVHVISANVQDYRLLATQEVHKLYELVGMLQKELNVVHNIAPRTNIQ
jgi:hypothetical protein